MNRRVFYMLALIFTMNGLIVEKVFSADWPQWRGPDRNGKSKETGLLQEWPDDGPALLWKHDDVGRGYSQPIQIAGTVYVTGDKDDRLMLTALDKKGQALWCEDIGQAQNRDNYPGSRAAPTYEAGLIYIVTAKGEIKCWDTRTRKTVWSKRMSDLGGKAGGWAYSESPLLIGDSLILTPGGETLMAALDKKTGTLLWTAKPDFQSRAHYSSPILVNYMGKKVIVNGTGGGIVGVDPLSKQMLWRNPFAEKNTANCPDPAFEDKYIFWANGYGKGGVCLQLSVANNKLDAREIWKTRDMDCHHGGYIIDKGYVYGNNGGGWACIDLATGSTAWKERGVGKGSVTYADGMLYTLSEGGKCGLVVCKPDAFTMKSEFRISGNGKSWAHPMISDGCLYLRFEEKLYCFDINKK